MTISRIRMHDIDNDQATYPIAANVAAVKGESTSLFLSRETKTRHQGLLQA